MKKSARPSKRRRAKETEGPSHCSLHMHHLWTCAEDEDIFKGTGVNPFKIHKRILLAVDGSEDALGAVRYVCRVFPSQEMEIVLFSVFSKIHEYFWDLEWDPRREGTMEELKVWEVKPKKALEEYMEMSKQILFDAGFSQKQVTVKIQDRKIGIARDIISEAQRGYSAVAVGRKGTSHLKDLVLGSVAAKVIEKLAFVSLLVIGNPLQPGGVLLALDGSEGAMRAVDYVGAMLGGSDFEVELFHVIRGNGKEYFDSATERIVGVFVKAKHRLVESGFRPRQIRNKILHLEPSRADAIVQEAKKRGYGTIVVGRRGLSNLPEFTMGRVSNKLIQLAEEHSVWVVS